MSQTELWCLLSCFLLLVKKWISSWDRCCLPVGGPCLVLVSLTWEPFQDLRSASNFSYFRGEPEKPSLCKAESRHLLHMCSFCLPEFQSFSHAVSYPSFGFYAKKFVGFSCHFRRQEDGKKAFGIILVMLCLVMVLFLLQSMLQPWVLGWFCLLSWALQPFFSSSGALKRKMNSTISS